MTERPSATLVEEKSGAEKGRRIQFILGVNKEEPQVRYFCGKSHFYSIQVISCKPAHDEYLPREKSNQEFNFLEIRYPIWKLSLCDIPKGRTMSSNSEIAT